ncbi:DUF2142 domain-containing protein [Nocardioides flavescens]|uniref:DUF2142 domain-containing protein n=1 Tax=Nocardioides flavescens TaxID=2691959 RepID=A0A6L7EQU7_9ACTN|nr:DUF2142 domain-containing protein [Nocardioides flavescens]
MHDATHRSRSSIGVAVVAFCAAILSAVAWALASAPGSSPDDNFHLPSIWCAHGEAAGRCESVPGDPDARAVPAAISGVQICFNFDAAESARCQQEVIAAAGDDISVGVGNWQGSYPPVYYWLQGLWVTSAPMVSVVLMRIFSALVVIAVLGALVALVPSTMRPAAVLPLLVSSVPLGLSLISSTNPSGWGIVGPASVLVALHAAFATTGRRRAALCGMAVIATFVGAGARADACLFTAMAVVLVFILNGRRLARQPAPVVTGVVAVGIAAVLFLGAGQASAVTGGLASEQVLGEASQMSTLELLWSNLTQMPTLWTGFLGSGPLGRMGWLDTPVPPLVGFLSGGVLLTTAVRCLHRAPFAHAIALGLSLASLIVYPSYVLVRGDLVVGQGMQPRYLLPLVVVLLALVLLSGVPRLSRGTWLALAGALSLANAIALHTQMRRYVTGTDVSALDLDTSREWWWDLPVGPTTVWALGVLGFAVTAFVALSLCVTRRDALERSEHRAPIA